MKGEIKGLYIKRTQWDYPLSFKNAVVRDVESGAINTAFKVMGQLLNGEENTVSLTNGTPLGANTLVRPNAPPMREEN